MDQERLDRITKHHSTGQSRRGLLKGLTGTALGGVLAAVGIGKTAAAPPAGKPSKCYGANSSCTNGKQCCSGTCTNRRCAPAIPVDLCAGAPPCTATSECFTAGTCNPSTGQCSAQTPKAADTPCSTGTCDGAGICAPLGPTCAGTCDPFDIGSFCGPGCTCSAVSGQCVAIGPSG